MEIIDGVRYDGVDITQIYDAWEKRPGVVVRIFDDYEDEAPLCVEHWRDWFNVSRQVWDVQFDVFVRKVDEDRYIVDAYIRGD